MSWRNPTYYLGDGDPFRRDHGDQGERKPRTVIINRITEVRENVPPKAFDDLRNEMVDIATKAAIFCMTQGDEE